jgi:hypothetical protein
VVSESLYFSAVMMNLANHMLMTTVAMVRLSHTGMKMFGRSVAVLETPVPAPLQKREGTNKAAAKPSMITVSTKSLRGEDLPPPPCDAS